jgi:hypothetical protein
VFLLSLLLVCCLFFMDLYIVGLLLFDVLFWLRGAV